MKKLNKSKIAIIYIMLISTVILVIDSGIMALFRHWLKLTIPNLDKVGHFFGTGILTFLIINLLHKNDSSGFTLKIIMGIFFTTCVFTLEEFSQKYLLFRTFSYGDLAADNLGILVFTMLFLWIIKKEKYRNSKVLQIILSSKS